MGYNYRLFDFLAESLRIEGIHRGPTKEELNATMGFLQSKLTVDSVCYLQSVYAPHRPLRLAAGMDVRVGSHKPPCGNPGMDRALAQVLSIKDPYLNHVAFENLHPFMEGNGRTGRAVWLYKMYEAGKEPLALGFLHNFYYQTLAASDARS